MPKCLDLRIGEAERGSPLSVHFQWSIQAPFMTAPFGFALRRALGPFIGPLGAVYQTSS
jgi:hypothetical protein